MPGHCVQARITLLDTGSGGLTQPLPDGTRSMLVVFDAEHSPQRVELGAMIITDTTDLVPGASDIDCRLKFWDDEARIHATPGVHFDLWYGWVVGHGVVTDVCDEAT